MRCMHFSVILDQQSLKWARNLLVNRRKKALATWPTHKRTHRRRPWLKSRRVKASQNLSNSFGGDFDAKWFIFSDVSSFHLASFYIVKCFYSHDSSRVCEYGSLIMILMAANDVWNRWPNHRILHAVFDCHRKRRFFTIGWLLKKHPTVYKVKSDDLHPMKCKVKDLRMSFATPRVVSQALSREPKPRPILR